MRFKFLIIPLLLISFAAEAQTTRRIQSSDVTGALGYTPIQSIQGMTGVMTCGTGLLCSSQVLSVSGVPIGSVSGLGTGVAAWLQTPTSANLIAAVPDETGTGSLVFGNSPALTGSVNIQSSSGNALAVGPNGITNPALLVSASASSGATGVQITNGAATFGAAISTISSGANEPLFINSKGASPISIGAVSTGGVILGSALTYGGVALSNSVTGTGSMVLSNSPVLVTPNLGTPSAGVGTNLTGTAAGLTAGTFTAGSAANLTSGTLPAARTNGHMNGTATNDNAAAGEVGEYATATLIMASAVSLTTATGANIISVSLTAGDWDVWGVGQFQPAGTTVTLYNRAAITTTSATFPSGDSGAIGAMSFGAGKTGGNNDWVVTPSVRISIASTTTVYLVAFASFTTSTNSVGGTIYARRRR